MWSSILTYFDTILSCSILSLGGPNTSSFIYRDELNKKSSPPKRMLIKKGDYCKAKRDYDNYKKSISGTIIDHDQDQQKGVIRVKVKMTKQEAARLMSKCKEGGVIGFKDVAHELVQIPIGRVSVVSSNSRPGSCGVLETISEE